MLRKILSEFKINGVARFVWAALLIGLLANVHTQEWADTVYAYYHNIPLYYGDMQWYIGAYLIVITLLAAIDVQADIVIAKIAIVLVFGKIADLFSCPFMYGANEFIFDILMGCIGLLLWLNCNKIGARFTNFVTDRWRKKRPAKTT